MNPREFDSIEHEVLFELLNNGRIIKNTEFLDIITPEIEIERALKYLDSISIISTNFYIGKSEKKIYGEIVFFIKRLIRKLIRWYINPIIEQQNKYNRASFNIIKTMYENFEELKNKQESMVK